MEETVPQSFPHPSFPWQNIFRFIIGLQLLYIALLAFQIYHVHTTTIAPLSAHSVMGAQDKDDGDADSEKLASVVHTSLKDVPGNYAIYIKNLQTGESYGMNEHRSFAAGSLYKLWIMATVYQQIKEGKIHPDDTIEADVTHLNSLFNIDEDNAELTSGTIEFTTRSALTQMVTISHNYAALALTEKLGLSHVSQFLSDNAFTESHVGGESGPTTTASDMALFFEKIHTNSLIDASSSAAMTTLLKQQKLNDKLPRFLPKTIAIAHKTGEIGMNSHDVGIVYAPKGPYIIAVLSETDMPSDAEDHIAALSRDVFRYFQQE